MSGMPVGVRRPQGSGNKGDAMGGRERGSRDASVKGLPARRFHGIMSVYERINERSGLL